MTEKSAVKIDEKDNVAVALKHIDKGKYIIIEGEKITVCENIPAGFKFAVNNIQKGENVIKYGYAIGAATENIAKGGIVHSHNLKSLSQKEQMTIKEKQNINISDITITFCGQNGNIGVERYIYYPHGRLR